MKKIFVFLMLIGLSLAVTVTLRPHNGDKTNLQEISINGEFISVYNIITTNDGNHLAVFTILDKSFKNPTSKITDTSIPFTDRILGSKEEFNQKIKGRIIQFTVISVTSTGVTINAPENAQLLFKQQPLTAPTMTPLMPPTVMKQNGLYVLFSSDKDENSVKFEGVPGKFNCIIYKNQPNYLVCDLYPIQEAYDFRKDQPYYAIIPEKFSCQTAYRKPGQDNSKIKLITGPYIARIPYSNDYKIPGIVNHESDLIKVDGRAVEYYSDLGFNGEYAIIKLNDSMYGTGSDANSGSVWHLENYVNGRGGLTFYSVNKIGINLPLGITTTIREKPQIASKAKLLVNAIALNMINQPVFNANSLYITNRTLNFDLNNKIIQVASDQKTSPEYYNAKLEVKIYFPQFKNLINCIKTQVQ
ncbi:Uncharacterised protein [uncultured archaeon]|nr:Uncharacterised protein [uncultured archaeon]